MRIVLVTTGSSGDVLPFIALGQGLRLAGNQVRLAGPLEACGLAEEHGLDFCPIDQNQRLGSLPKQLAKDKGLARGNTLKFGLLRMQGKKRIYRQVNLAVWQACQAADILIYRIGGYLAVDSIAEKLGVPCIKAGLVPYTPTREFPSIRLFRGKYFGALGNRLSHTLAEQVVWQTFRRAINDFRENVLGLPSYPISGPGSNSFTNRLPVLYGFSPALLPPPKDWPRNVFVSGHWNLESDRSWQPPAGLLSFLEAGPAPVYVGFGSMVSQDLVAASESVYQAIKQCGVRAVIAGNWAGLKGKAVRDKQIYLLEYAPHCWLFPHMIAVVHHGGIGTTTNGLKAGVPNIIVPFNYDQPFWGELVSRRGCGPKPVHFRVLTTDRLAEAIQTALNDDSIRRNAVELGAKMRRENGLVNAIEFISHMQPKY